MTRRVARRTGKTLVALTAAVILTVSGACWYLDTPTHQQGVKP